MVSIIQKVSSLGLMLRSASPEREGRLAPPEREGREGFTLLDISIAKGWGYVKQGRYSIIILMINCIRCKTKLIPIVYGRIDPEVLDMQDKGLLLISLDKHKSANSYCPLCEEAYGDYTDTPSFSE
jgi:hypothetical protein